MILDEFGNLGYLTVVEDATATVSGISYANTFDGFQKGGRVDIQSFEDGLEVDILLLWLGIVAVFGQHHQIAIVPLHDIHIPLQTVGCPETDVIPSEAESGESTTTAKYGLMGRGL